MNLDALWQDVVYAARMLRKRRLTTFISLVTLAVGLAATTTVFSVASSVLLRPLPFRDADRLVHIARVNPAVKGMGGVQRVSVPDFFDFRARHASFDALGAFIYRSSNLASAGAEADRVQGGWVTANLFDLLGVHPAIGRGFETGEDLSGKGGVVLLSHGLWSSRFAGRADVIGQSVSIDGVTATIVGVMPEGFEFPMPTTRFWTPLVLKPDAYPRDVGYLEVVGRLRPGITRPAAAANLVNISGALERDFPRQRGLGVRVVPLRQGLVFFFDFFQILMVLLGAAGFFVLLIVCATVTGLLLAQGAARRRELAVRAALGAPRWRVARELLIESALLSLGGGLGAVVLSLWGVPALGAALPPAIYRVGSIGVDRFALLFTLAMTVVTAALLGLVPALRARAAPDALREATPTGGGHVPRQRLRRTLVVAQVCLSLVLLNGAVVMLTDAARLRATPMGFDPHHVLTADMSLPAARYADETRMQAFYERMLDGIETIPGVQAAALVAPLPLNFQTERMDFSIVGRTPTRFDEKLTAISLTVTGRYFAAMGIPVVRGRVFDDRDQRDAPKVTVINATMARLFWPDRDPIGQRVNDCTACSGIEGQAISGDVEIIGVVADTKHGGLWEAAQPQIYLNEAQRVRRAVSIVVRTASDPLALAPAVRRAVREIDAELPLGNLRTMEEVVASSIRPWTVASAAIAVLGGTAFFLAVLGIYGVLSFIVSLRTQEIGVRISLGARPRDVVRMVVTSGLRMIALGIVFGVLGAIALARVMAAAAAAIGATGVDTSWVATIRTPLSVGVLLFVVGMLASYMPARRASRVDPIIALRNE